MQAPIQECGPGDPRASKPSWSNAAGSTWLNVCGFEEMEDLGYLGEEDGKPTCAQAIAEACASGHAAFVANHPEWAKRQEVYRCGDDESEGKGTAEEETEPRGGSGPLGRAYARSFEQLEKLHRAVKSLNVDAVRTALAGGGDPNQGDAKDGKNTLALLMNFHYGESGANVTELLEIVRMLAAHGADPDKKWF